MSSKGIEAGSVIVILGMLWVRTVAQSGCTNVLIGMAPCLNYVTGSNSSNLPSSSCCSSLASVVKSQPQCLCTALNGGVSAALGININQTLALALPAACNVQTPPVSHCYATTGPSPPPVGSPETLPSQAPAGAPISPSVSGSRSAPVNGASTSVGTTLKTPFIVVTILQLMALRALTSCDFKMS